MAGKQRTQSMPCHVCERREREPGVSYCALCHAAIKALSDYWRSIVDD